MRNVKKCLAIVLTLILFVGMVPASTFSVDVFAADGDVSSYGAQLSGVREEIYDALVDKYIGEDGLANGDQSALNVELNKTKEYKSYEEMCQAIVLDAEYAVFAFFEDHPQIFWANSYGLSLNYYPSQNKVASVKVTLNNYLTVTEEQIEAFNDGVAEAMSEIRRSLSNNASVFEKYQAIHDWVCEEAFYNNNGATNPSAYPETHTAYPIFHESGDDGVVCEGYAKAYKILCEQMDLTCMLISGVGVSADGSTQAHMWNKVQMPDGKWYGVDATWDDQENKIYYDYFLCGENSPCFTGMTFANDHIKDNILDANTGIRFEYPKVAEYGYNGYLGPISYSYNNGTLVISGNGVFPEYIKADRTPWYQYVDKITTLIIEKDVTSMPEGCFSNLDNLESLTIPYVGLSKDATAENAVLGAIFGKTDASGTIQYHGIENSSYQGYYYDIPSSLRKVVVTNDDNLEFGAFYNCSNLQSLILNSGMDEIASESMYNCASLTEILIPDTVETIGIAALQGCENLKSITLPFIGSSIESAGTSDAVLGHVFGYGDSNDTAQYYSANKGYYYNIPSTLQSVTVTKDDIIPYGAFYNCSNITSIRLDAKVEWLQSRSFYGCTGLKNLTFMDNTNSPNCGMAVFDGCDNITVYVNRVTSSWSAFKDNNIPVKTYNLADIAAKISSAKINIGDRIGVKFMVAIDETLASESDYMNLTVNGNTNKIYVSQATTETSNLTGETKHVFECKLNAKEMTKPIKAQMSVRPQTGNIRYEGKTVTYSVKSYADAILGMAAGTYEAEKAMLRAMLNYGGYAQTYFGETQNLANDGLYEESTDPVLNLNQIDLSEYEPTGANVDKIKATLLLESETELRFYFEPGYSEEIGDYIFLTPDEGVDITSGKVDGKLYVGIKNIRATELKDMYTISILNLKDNSLHASITYSAMSYVRTVLNDSNSSEELKNLVKSLYLYSEAADEYWN